MFLQGCSPPGSSPGATVAQEKTGLPLAAGLQYRGGIACGLSSAARIGNGQRTLLCGEKAANGLKVEADTGKSYSMDGFQARAPN